MPPKGKPKKPAESQRGKNAMHHSAGKHHSNMGGAVPSYEEARHRKLEKK